MLALGVALASDPAVITLDPFSTRRIGGISLLDRTKWFGGHWDTAGEWRPQDVTEYRGYRAHPGRGFAVSGLMSMLGEDPARPGFVDRAALLKRCKAFPPVMAWPASEVDFITSAKTEQFYANGCAPGTPGPKGFVPQSHAAAAEVFALYYQHCMTPTTRRRYLCDPPRPLPRLGPTPAQDGGDERVQRQGVPLQHHVV